MKRLALLAALVLSPSAQAAPAWHGVWQGTIGTLPVRACLQQRSEDYSNGSYYYLSRLQPIPLSREDDGGWSEENGSGRWTVTSAGDRLTGTWRGGGKSLPIALTRVAVAPGDEDPCGSQAYIAPRLRPVKIVTKPARKDGFAYSELVYDVGSSFPEVGISSFAYPPTRPGDAAINAALRLDPTKPEGEADYLGCMKMALASGGRDGDFQFSYAPDLVTPAYLSVAASSGGFCGGAHPDESLWHRVFDRASGRQVDLAGWLTPRGVAPGDGERNSSIRLITPALRALALKHFPFGRGEDADCREAVSDEDYWEIALTRRGLAFTPSLPHVVQACEDAAVVPFADLAPFLSPAGRTGIARLAR
ncbi:MAG: hypothetical protein ACTHLU_09475 [Novosphingobium sp.]